MAGKFNLLTILTLDAAGYKSGINGAKKDTDIFKNQLVESAKSVQNLYSAMLGGVGAFAIITVGVDMFKSSIESSGLATDKWAEVTESARFATDYFNQSLINMDFTGFISGISRAITAGEDYAKIIDELEDKQRGLTVHNSTYKADISALKLQLAQTSNSKEKLKIIKQIQDLENKMYQETSKVSKEGWEKRLNTYAKGLDISTESLKQYITQTGNYSEAEEKAKKYLEIKKAIGALNLVQSKTPFMQQQYSKWTEEIKNASKQTIEFSKIMIHTNDAVRDELINSFVQIESDRQETSDRQIKLAKNERSINDSNTKNALKNSKLIRDDANKGFYLGSKAQLIADGRKDLNLKDLNPISNLVTSSLKSPSINGLSDVTNSIKENNKIKLGLEKDFAAETLAIHKQLEEDKLYAASDTFGALASIFGEQTIAYKAFAITQASIDTYMAANRALSSAPPPFNFILMGATIAAGLANISKIAAFANGGIVGGSAFSGDNITARVNSGEMILNRSQQANLFAMANGSGGGYGGGSVEFKIAGSNLVGVLSNHNRKINNTR